MDYRIILVWCVVVVASACDVTETPQADSSRETGKSYAVVDFEKAAQVSERSAKKYSVVDFDKSEQPRKYLDTIPLFWRTLYPDGGESLYCGKRFRPYDRAMNVEHVFPMSWVTKALKCGDRNQCRRSSNRFNAIESDLHNLFPARKDINKTRGSYRLGMIKGERHIERDCDFEVDYDARVAEPRPAVRGDIARAMLYMEKEYGLPLHDRNRAVMKRWNREDRPSADERRRNDEIERIQGNRNSFIDN